MLDDREVEPLPAAVSRRLRDPQAALPPEHQVPVEEQQRALDQPLPPAAPALYGFVPRTYCGRRVGALCPVAKRGDGDPIDICVVSERPIDRSEIVLTARVVGGLQFLDGGEADDKIIGVLESDLFWGGAEDLSDLPQVLVERLQHYFSTYKLVRGEPPTASLESVYGRDRALEVVQASIDDYREEYP